MKFKKLIQFKSLLIISMFIGLLVTESCNNSSDSKAVIKGQIIGFENQELVLESLMPKGVDTIASVSTDNKGNFLLELDSIPGGFLLLRLDVNNAAYLYVRDGETITVKGNYPGLVKSYSVEGSTDSELLHKMNLRLIESSDKLNVWKDDIILASSNPDINLDSIYNATNDKARELYESDKQFLIDFINENPKSPVIYMALYQYIGTSPILMIENDLEIYEFVLEQLKANNPELPHLNSLESTVNKEKLYQQQTNKDYVNLQIGSEAPDFTMTDNNNKSFNLSDLSGQKIVIAFWSSLNKMTLDNMKYLKDLKEKFNLEIVTISIETNKEKWSNSINAYDLEEFVNLCDFKSWDGSVVKVYGVKSIPYFVVVDQDQIVNYTTNDVYDLKDSIEKLN